VYDGCAEQNSGDTNSLSMGFNSHGRSTFERLTRRYLARAVDGTRH
jgi:hypothetical protein